MADTALPKIVVLTGAGISAESGLRTFRDADGLWENHKVEDVATPEAFLANPQLVYKFYNERREQLKQKSVTPNPAHVALAQLEKEFGDNVLIITQNVDNLHERAGSKRVLHMHGELNSARCSVSGQSVPWFDSFDGSTRCSCCENGSPLRPDIVWFGEMPMFMDEIFAALFEADIFLSIGTSGHVYPAAGFVQQANQFGAETYEINLEASAVCEDFDRSLLGKAGDLVPEFVDNLLKHHGLK